MKTFRLLMLGLGMTGFATLSAMVAPYQFADEIPSSEYIEFSPSVIPDSIADWEFVDPESYLSEETYNQIQKNPYITDKEAAKDFYIAKVMNYLGEHSLAQKYFRALAEKKYPYALHMTEKYENWFGYADVLNRYDSLGSTALSPDELESVAVVIRDEGDEERAVILLEEAWRRGCHSAASTLGQLYYHNGFDGFMDEGRLEKALAWTERGIASGDSIAIYNMGVYYDEGMVRPFDSKMAASYYERAAAMNVPSALNNLACLYSVGAGVDKDLDMASELMARAAEVGHGYAAVNRALYELNRGNYDKCRHYISQAIKADRIDIYNQLIDAILNDRPGKSLKERPELLEFLKSVYDEGATCGLLLPDYENNIPVIFGLLDADWDEIGRNAKAGNVEAKKQMMWDVMYGLVSESDRTEALRRFEDLVKTDDRYRLALGLAYWNSSGMQHDYKNAKRHLKKFAKTMQRQEKKVMAAAKKDENAWSTYPIIEWLGAEYSQSYKIYPIFGLEPETITEIKNLDHLMDLESRKNQILRKSEMGDAKAMYEFYELIMNNIYNPLSGTGLGYPATHCLRVSANAGCKEAIEEMSEHYNSLNIYPAAAYWHQKLDDSRE